MQIQTYSPEHPCIALAAAHDYETFVARELDQRRLHNYPPYQRLVRLIIRSLDQEAAFIASYRRMLEDRLNRLEDFLERTK